MIDGGLTGAKNQLTKDLRQVLMLAMKHRGKSADLPLSNSHGARFIVSVTIDHSELASWRLYADAGTNLVWEKESKNINSLATEIMELIDRKYLPSMAQAVRVDDAQPAAVAPSPKGTGTMTPQSGPVAFAGNTQLSGSLALVKPPNVVQSINMSEMSGRLTVVGKHKTAHIFFVEGAPIHATFGDESGEVCFLELLSWTDGTFVFEHNLTTPEKTIEHKLPWLLLRGAQYADDVAFLEARQVTDQSSFKRTSDTITEPQFEAALSTGAPLDIGPQKQIYRYADGRKTALELTHRLNIPKLDWVTMICNLIRCGLLEVVNQAPLKKSGIELTEIPIDTNALQNLKKGLINADSGLYTYPALLFFLQQEMLRSERFGNPVSLMILSVSIKRTGLLTVREAVPKETITEAIRRIQTITGSTDLICHYDVVEYAILMPNVSLSEAAILARKMSEVLTATALPRVNPQTLLMRLGVAGVPGDVQSAQLLLSAASIAKRKAEESDRLYVLFRDIS